MGFFSKDIKTMDDLFVQTLRDIYYAEGQILQALPDMIEKAHDAQLKQGFETHLRETRDHVKRLEKVFQMHGTEPVGVDCQPLTASSRKRTTSRVKLRTVPFWMLRSLPLRKPSSTTRSPATAA